MREAAEKRRQEAERERAHQQQQMENEEKEKRAKQAEERRLEEEKRRWAEKYKFGIRAIVGLGVTDLPEDGLTGDEGGSRGGGIYGLGGVADISLYKIDSDRDFRVAAGLDFVLRNYPVDEYEGEGRSRKWQLRRDVSEIVIGIPIFLRLKCNGWWFWGIGLQAEIPLSVNVSPDEDAPSMSSFNLGFGGELGFYIGKHVMIDIRYIRVDAPYGENLPLNQVNLGAGWLF